MKWKKEQLILVSLIAVLAVYLLVQKSGRTHYTLPRPEPINQNGITKLEIGTTGGGIDLVQKDGRWVIEPQEYPADRNAVDGMLGKIAGLALSALVSETGSLTVYGLDPEHGIRVRAFAGDALARSFLVGKTAPSGRHTFVKLDAEKGIFHAEGDLRSAFATTVSRLRDKIIMKIDEEVTRLALRKGERRMTIVRAEPSAPEGKKDDAGQGGAGPRWKTAAGKPANDREVGGMLDALKNLACDEFLEGKKKSDFTRPAYTVTLEGAKTYSLSLYKDKDNSFAGVSSESEYPFRLSEWRAKQIMKEFTSLAGAK